MKGSTIKRGQTWTAYWFTMDPATGKRRQHSKGGFRLQKDARAHLNEVLTKVDQGAWRPDTKMTVGKLLDDWLAAKTSEGLRPARWTCTATSSTGGYSPTSAASGWTS